MINFVHAAFSQFRPILLVAVNTLFWAIDILHTRPKIYFSTSMTSWVKES